MKSSLDDMLVFAVVVETESFTKAADELGLGRSRVSQIITRLEERLGVRLLNRTTRSLSLTDHGIRYYQQCRLIQDIANEAHNEISDAVANPSGLIRIATPIGMDFLAGLLSGFLAQYPDVRVELLESDRYSNLVENRADLAIRVGHLADSSLHAFKLGAFRDILCASKAYAARYDLAGSPENLAKMKWVSHVDVHGDKSICLKSQAGKEVRINHQAYVGVRSVHSLKQFLLSDVGFGLIPSFCIKSELDEGTLVELLPDHHCIDVPVYAVFPERNLMPHATRVLLDYMKENSFTF